MDYKWSSNIDVRVLCTGRIAEDICLDGVDSVTYGSHHRGLVLKRNGEEQSKSFERM